METGTALALVDRYPDAVADEGNELGALVKELREARGLSQSALADIAGMSGAQISRIESTSGTSPETIDRIAQALRVDAGMLHTAYAASKGIRITEIPLDNPHVKAVLVAMPYLSEEFQAGIAAQVTELAKIQRRLAIEAQSLDDRTDDK